MYLCVLYVSLAQSGSEGGGVDLLCIFLFLHGLLLATVVFTSDYLKLQVLWLACFGLVYDGLLQDGLYWSIGPLQDGLYWSGPVWSG